MNDKDRVCPSCSKTVPTNEWFAYGRHEDCAMNRKPCTTESRIPAVLRNSIRIYNPGMKRAIPDA